MAGSGIWKVQVKSHEALEKGTKPDEGAVGLNFRLRFKTGEYAKDADAEESTPASFVNLWA